MIDDDFDDAVELANCGQFERAIKAIDKLLEMDPEHVGGLALRGYLLAMLGDHGPAETCIARAIDLEPDYAQAHYAWGVLQATKGELSTAVLSFERAAELEPEDMGFLSEVARVHLELGNLPSATGAINRLTERAPFDPTVLTLRAQIAAAHGKIDDARECAQLALKRDPALPNALGVLAQIEFDSGNFEPAAKLAADLTRIAPDDFGAQYTLAASLAEQGEFEAALAAVERFLSNDKGNGVALALKAQILTRFGALEEAQPVLRQAKKIGPDAAYIAFVEGQFNQARGALPAAADAFEHALALEPDYLESIDALAQICHRLGNRKKLIKAIQRMRHLAAGNVDALLSCAARAEEFGLDDELLAAAESVLEMQPDNEGARILLGFRHLRRLEFDQARLLAEDLLTRDPEDPSAKTLLASVDAATSGRGRLLHRVFLHLRKLGPHAPRTAFLAAIALLTLALSAVALHFKVSGYYVLIYFGLLLAGPRLLAMWPARKKSDENR